MEWWHSLFYLLAFWQLDMIEPLNNHWFYNKISIRFRGDIIKSNFFEFINSEAATEERTCNASKIFEKYQWRSTFLEKNVQSHRQLLYKKLTFPKYFGYFFYSKRHFLMAGSVDILQKESVLNQEASFLLDTLKNLS